MIAPTGNGVMIALCPMNTDWAKQPCPHMTLVYAGKVDDLKITDINELAKDASMLTMLSGPFSLKVTGVQQFGDDTAGNPRVDVMTLEPSSQILAMRRAVEQWNASQFPFNPHVTIGPVGSAQNQVLPSALSFNQIIVGWGTDYLNFWLKGAGSGW